MKANTKDEMFDIVTGCFWLGFGVCGAGLIFVQDFLGKEVYMKMLEDNWVNIHWSVGLILGLVMIAVYSFSKKRAKRIIGDML